MYYYHFHQWLAFFYFYCIFGWCFETTYVSLKNKKFVNRGFMKGPWLPIYGSGAIAVLFTTLPVQKNPVLVYIIGMLTATVLEYIIGAGMLAFFKVRYWDYSYRKFQLNGHICLVSSLAWGVLTLLLIYLVQEPFSKLVLALNTDVLSVIVEAMTFMIAFDFANSFRKAMDLRALIIQAERLSREMAERADWKVAYAREDLANKKKIAEMRRDYMLDFWGDQAEARIDAIQKELSQRKLGAEERLAAFESMMDLQMEEIAQRRDALLDSMIPNASHSMRHNPGFTIPSLPKGSSKLREMIFEEYNNRKMSGK